jgi:predicted amidophosphoribosyltransferase
MRTCPECFNQVEDQATFCDNCGLQLPPVNDRAVFSTGALSAAADADLLVGRSVQPAAGNAQPGTCSACGYVNVPGEMFCQNCGVQLAPIASAPPPLPTPVSAMAAGFARDRAAQPGACPACGYVNPQKESFCMNCGSQLVSVHDEPAAPVDQPKHAEVGRTSGAVCDYCGYARSPGEQYCDQCGKQFSASTADLPQARLASADPFRRSGKLVVRATRAEIILPSAKVEWLLGRSDPARDFYPDIDLGSHGGETGGVSRRHARLSMSGIQLFIEDLNSTNFTFLNQRKLEPGQLYELSHGDEIRLGLLILEYHST